MIQDPQATILIFLIARISSSVMPSSSISILPSCSRRCICNYLQLLIHFFQHEMLVSAFFCCMNVPVNFYRFLFNRFFINIEEFNVIFSQFYDLFIFNKIYVSCIFSGLPERLMQSDFRLLLFQRSAENLFRTAYQFIRMIIKNDSKRIRSFHTMHYFCNRAEAGYHHNSYPAPGRYFCIGIRNKLISFFNQTIL